MDIPIVRSFNVSPTILRVGIIFSLSRVMLNLIYSGFLLVGALRPNWRPPLTKEHANLGVVLLYKKEITIRTLLINSCVQQAMFDHRFWSPSFQAGLVSPRDQLILCYIQFGGVRITKNVWLCICIVFLLYICLSDSKSDDGGDFFDPGDDDDLDEVPDDVSIELS